MTYRKHTDIELGGHRCPHKVPFVAKVIAWKPRPNFMSDLEIVVPPGEYEVCHGERYEPGWIDFRAVTWCQREICQISNFDEFLKWKEEEENGRT